MKTTNVFRFVCFVFAWLSTHAGNVPTRAEQPALDDRVKINTAPRVREPGIKGCMAPRFSSYKVRVQSLKTSGGSVYTRQLVTTADLPCFKNSDTKAFPKATNIAQCAEATAKAGLNSFSWENRACTAYLAWRPQKRADCKDGGSKVVYVVKAPLTPFAGGKIIVSGKLRYDARPQVFLDFSHYYDGSCGFSSRINKGYKLIINGSDVVMLPEGNGTYSLSRKLLCSGSVNISLWSVDADGKVNSQDSQVITIEAGQGSDWYGLKTGGCIYEAQREDSYNGSLQYCNAMGGTLYHAEVAGGAIAFLNALTDIEFYNDGVFYVGLLPNGNGPWSWLGGLPQPLVDDVWARPPDPSEHWDCGFASRMPGPWRIDYWATCTVPMEVVCYFPNH